MCDILNVRVFSSRRLLFGALSLQLCLNVMLHGVVDELVLSFRLHHARALRAHHLNGPMDVDLTVESLAINLVENHVYHNEGAGAANAGGAVNTDGSLRKIEKEESIRIRVFHIPCRSKLCSIFYFVKPFHIPLCFNF